jgi:MFS transporter, FHS family, glucose/mannose:H+ symporter
MKSVSRKVNQDYLSPKFEWPAGWRSASSLMLAVGFCLTGVGTVMLGVLLPILSRKWGLRDDAAGFLFFLEFGGSSLGALFTGLNRLRAMRIGYALLVLATFALIFADSHTVYAIFFVFGLGLGMAMTATSLLFSDRHDADRAQMLEGLNFVWSAGAMAAPLLLLPAARAGHLLALLITLLTAFLMLLAWAILRERNNTAMVEAMETGVQEQASIGAVTVLVSLAVCAVGVETALSSWLTSYVHRLAPESHGALFPVTLFYLGVVVSRFLCSTSLLQRVGQIRALQGLLWGTAVSIAALVALHNAAPVNAVAALTGLCIGPLYPLALALLLQRTSRGWIFAMAGMGAAFFPWLTGVSSAHFGSLRYGLLVPLTAAWMLALLRPVFMPSNTANMSVSATT